MNSSRVNVHLIDFGNCNFNGDYSTPDEVKLSPMFYYRDFYLGSITLLPALNSFRMEGYHYHPFKSFF